MNVADLKYSPASVRNSAPLLNVLRHEFSSVRTVLEIGSGTGQHAVYFSRHMPDLTWQTSDLAENHMEIRAHIEDAGLDNVLEPIAFDASSAPTPAPIYDAVFSCNTAHIMSWHAVEGMVAHAGGALNADGRFCCYGPFSRNGKFNTDSNEAFDRSLRARDSNMGIRDLDDVDELAAAASMARSRIYAMPANNYLVVWRMLNERRQE